MGGVEDHFLGGAPLHDLAGVHDHDVVGDVIQQGQLVGDEHHGLDVALFHELPHHLNDHLLAGHVQRGGGLVGNQNLGVQDGGHGDDGTLLHAAGQLHGVLIQNLRRQAQLGKPGFRHFPDDLFIHLGVMGVNHVLDEADDLLGGVQGVHGGLGDVGDLGAQDGFADGIGVHAGNVLPVDDDIAADVVQGGEVIAHQAQRQGGFAAAGFAGDAQGLAFFDLEGDTVNGIDVLPEAGNILGFEVPNLQHHLARGLLFHVLVRHNCLLSLSGWG